VHDRFESVVDLFIDSLKDYFSQFGEVSECTVMRDVATGRSRGFGFLTFRDPKCVNTVMVKEHYLDGKIVSSLVPFPLFAICLTEID
jgi:RNA recognition motif-containing protein